MGLALPRPDCRCTLCVERVRARGLSQETAADHVPAPFFPRPNLLPHAPRGIRPFRSTTRMRVRLRLALSIAILASVAACKDGPTAPKGPFDTPLPASLKVGDLVRVNVNGEQGCTNAIIRAARVVAIGGKSMILSDTLNPPVGSRRRITSASRRSSTPWSIRSTRARSAHRRTSTTTAA